MTVGIPKGLLYSKYHVFAESFFRALGMDIITSPDTNKEILNKGVKSCVDDACLPIKVFHGHVQWLKDKCDYLLMPRLFSLEKRKSLCPMFCGLVEMVKSSVPELPLLIDSPVYSLDKKSLLEWAMQSGRFLTIDKEAIADAFVCALKKQKNHITALNDDDYAHRIALIGHTYNIHDAFINMHLIKKLHAMDIGVVTTDSVDKNDIALQTGMLYKAPFWYFAREYYGAAISLYKNRLVDGFIYVSAFSCGVDSVVIELIKLEMGSFPFMVLKIDEHTGEAAIDTRIEAYADMLKRRAQIGYHRPAYGQHMPCRQSVF